MYITGNVTTFYKTQILIIYLVTYLLIFDTTVPIIVRVVVRL